MAAGAISVGVGGFGGSAAGVRRSVGGVVRVARFSKTPQVRLLRSWTCATRGWMGGAWLSPPGSGPWLRPAPLMGGLGALVLRRCPVRLGRPVTCVPGSDSFGGRVGLDRWIAHFGRPPLPAGRRAPPGWGGLPREIHGVSGCNIFAETDLSRFGLGSGGSGGPRVDSAEPSGHRVQCWQWLGPELGWRQRGEPSSWLASSAGCEVLRMTPLDLQHSCIYNS
jgi:hypothetical protein